jgi:hypothetical protein
MDAVDPVSCSMLINFRGPGTRIAEPDNHRNDSTMVIDGKTVITPKGLMCNLYYK